MSRKISALFLSLLLLNGFALAVTGGDVKTIQDFTSVVGTFSGTVGAGDSAQPSSGQVQQVSLTIINCP